jgi:L-threonate 2-dehydrogenase
MSHPARVGVVGVGAMGLPMAQRLQRAAYAVTVHDIDNERQALAAAAGCAVATSPHAVAAVAQLLIVVVVNGAQTREVLFGAKGAAAALAPGSAVMLCPTIGPQDTETIAQALQQLGIHTLDAPLSGGPVRAADGSMSLMLACSDALYSRWLPLLQCLSSQIFRVGLRPGDGARTKLVNNLLAAINLAGAAEALALAARIGLDPAQTLAVIEASSGQSWIGSQRLQRALAGHEHVQARTALLAKDSGLALAMAQQMGFDCPLGAAATQRFAQALGAGLGELDDSSLWRWQLPKS